MIYLHTASKIKNHRQETYAIEIVAGVLAVEVTSTVLDVAGVRQLSNVQLGEESEHLRQGDWISTASAEM